MTIHVNDVVFSHDGKPLVVKTKNKETGNITVDQELSEVQKASPNGIRNGLPEDTREAYKLVLEQIKDPDKRMEIENLHKRLGEIKFQTNDKRLVRYLENELQYRMIRDKYQPQQFEVDAYTLTK